MQRMNVYIKDIFVFVNQLDGFLYFPVDFDLFKSPENSDPMIYMGHVIAGIEPDQLLRRNRFLFAEPVMEPELVVAFKDLVVGIER